MFVVHLVSVFDSSTTFHADVWKVSGVNVINVSSGHNFVGVKFHIWNDQNYSVACYWLFWFCNFELNIRNIEEETQKWAPEIRCHNFPRNLSYVLCTCLCRLSALSVFVNVTLPLLSCGSFPLVSVLKCSVHHFADGSKKWYEFKICTCKNLCHFRLISFEEGREGAEETEEANADDANGDQVLQSGRFL